MSGGDTTATRNASRQRLAEDAEHGGDLETLTASGMRNRMATEVIERLDSAPSAHVDTSDQTVDEGRGELVV